MLFAPPSLPLVYIYILSYTQIKHANYSNMLSYLDSKRFECENGNGSERNKTNTCPPYAHAHTRICGLYDVGTGKIKPNVTLNLY